MEANNSTRKRKFRLLLLACLTAGLVLLLAVYYEIERREADAETKANVNTATSGNVMLYASIPTAQLKIYLEAFKAEYPDINVTWIRERSPTLTEKVLAEGDNTPAEVIWGLPAVNMMFIKWNGLLKSYPSVDLSRIRPNFRDADTPPDWLGMEARLFAFCVNTAGLEERGLPVPTSWQDLVDPMYKGQVVTSEGQSSTGYGVTTTAFVLYGEPDGWEYIRQLNQNVGRYSPKEIPAVNGSAMVII